MQRLGYSVVQEEVLRSISPLRQQTVASVGRAKSVCLMAKTPECPSEPAMSLLLFGSFSAYPTPPDKFDMQMHMAIQVLPKLACV